MKIIHKNQTKIFENSDSCTALDYQFGDKDLYGSVIELNGRYPDKNRVVNLKCKESSYVIKGSGKLVVEGEEIKLNEGDMVLIDAGEKYFWEGNLTMLVLCSPPWYAEQHKEVE